MGCAASLCGAPCSHIQVSATTAGAYRNEEPTGSHTANGEKPAQLTQTTPGRSTFMESGSIGTRVLIDDGATHRAEKLTILHFNDVYNIEEHCKDPVGGAARFVSLVKSMKKENPLIVFSGDAFNPSVMSTYTQGQQMPPVLNAIGTHVACVGNHDFDHGMENMNKLINKCDFPWLLANIWDPKTKLPVLGLSPSGMIHWQGYKIGVIGLGEEEWLETLTCVDMDQVYYVDAVKEGRRLAHDLREAGAEFIIAITHQRMHNDIRLAGQVQGIDLVLGGHDHHYEITDQNKHGTLVVNSGTDFRDLTKLEIRLCHQVRDGNQWSHPYSSGEAVHDISEMSATLQTGSPGALWKDDPRGFSIRTTRYAIDLSIPPHEPTKKIVDSYVGKINSHMDEVIAHTDETLDGRFLQIRSRETNLGVFIADIIRQVMKTDIGFVNSGTLRSDEIHGPGPITMRDLTKILPLPDTIVALELSGADFHLALENSVAAWPKLEGRFAQISGASFTFDPTKPPGERVPIGLVKIGSKKIDPSATYTLATKDYVLSGRDGYAMFKRASVLVDQENGPSLPTTIRNYCMELDRRGQRLKSAFSQRNRRILNTAEDEIFISNYD